MRIVCEISTKLTDNNYTPDSYPARCLCGAIRGREMQLIMLSISLRGKILDDLQERWLKKKKKLTDDWHALMRSFSQKQSLHISNSTYTYLF